MTFWDRLIADYPEMAKYKPEEIRVKCPVNYGYEKKRKGVCASISCRECWQREMEEKE